MATQLFKPETGTPAWFMDCVERSKAGPFIEVTTLSPPLAKAMLQQNFDNRSIRQVKVTQYAADMAEGRWAMNGEPIIVAVDGKLNDGQHRCLANLEANAEVPVVIMFGIDRETRLTVDQGGARTAGDFLSMEGVANGPAAAAIARMVIAFERNDGKGLGNGSHITSAEIRDRVYQDPAIAEATTFGHTNAHYARRFMPGSLIGFAYYILTRINPTEGKTFLERVCRGDGLRLRDPAYTLREKLVGESSRDRRAAMIFKAWNFHRRGMKVSASSLTSTLPFPALL
jgi:hypothetical protein